MPERNPDGTFAEGNSGGPGNPHAAKVAKLRSALIDAVTEQDMRDIISGLVERAKQGDVAAVKVIMRRTLGKPLEPDIIARIEALENAQ